MCYFLSLRVTPQKRVNEAEAATTRLAQHFGVRLQGKFPELRITNGHCSCDYVASEANALSLLPLIDALVKTEELKSVEVGWTWGGNMKADAVVERLIVQEFAARNQNKSLKPDIWYRLSDPEKYRF